MHAIALLLSLLPLLDAKPLRRNTVVHERRDTVPSGFVKVGAAPASQTLTLRLGLRQGDMAGLQDKLMSVSTPSSAEYGQFLSKEEV